MRPVRATHAVLLSLGLALSAHHARAQGEELPPIGPPAPPRPDMPEVEEEPRPLDAVTPEPVPAPLPVPEEPPRTRFGAPGVFVVANSFSLQAGSTSYDASGASSSYLSISPDLDYFFARHLSLGIDVTASWEQSRGYGADSSLVQTTTTVLGVGPRFGVDIPLGRYLSWYPRLTLGVESEHREERVVSGSSASVSANPFATPSTTQTGPTISLFTPLLLHPVPHFFFGLGPSVFHEFGRTQGGPDIGGERTTFAARVVLGLWWGGGPEGSTPAPEAPPPTAAREARFGDANHVFFTGEIGASVYASVYGGTDSRLTSVSVSPGFDYFVLSQVSLGFGFSAEYFNQVGVEPSGAKVTSEVTIFSGAPRLGVNLPVASWVSVYLRGEVGYAVRNYNEQSGRARDAYTANLAYVGLYTPVLFHFASHAFVGFGPYLSHDVSESVPEHPSRKENLSTSFGVNFIVGGWL